MNLQALKTELTTDPLGKNYAAMDDEQAAASLAVVDRQANRDTVSGGMLAASVVRSEWAALATANDRQYVQALIGAGEIPLTANFKTELGALFPTGSTTRANLIALLKRPGSRAEELDLGGNPTPSQVADARRLP